MEEVGPDGFRISQQESTKASDNQAIFKHGARLGARACICTCCASSAAHIEVDCRNTGRGRSYILPKSHTKLGLKGSDVSHIQLE